MRPSMAVHRCAAGSPARTIAPHQRHPTRIAAAPPKALQITPREREAYHSLQQGGILAPGETPTQGASRLIERAATAKDVPNDHVIAAMATMELEQATQVPLAQLKGTWRLVFSSSSTLPAFQYIPVAEDAVIDPSTSSINLQTRFGALVTAFEGAFEWNDEHSDMFFGFSRLVLLWNGRRVWETPLTIPYKTYRWFYASEDGQIVLARSSDGGVTLLAKVDE